MGKKVTYFGKHYQIYLLIIPAVIYFFIFNYLPMLGLSLAFQDYRFSKGMFFSPWVGFKYFQTFFDYFNSWNIIRNTLIISFYKIIVFFPIPIIFAIMLNEIRNSYLKRVIQTIFYLPYFISWVVAITIFQQFLSLDGMFNQIRESLGLEAIYFMNDPTYFYPIMFISYVWKMTGWSAIIYLAAISGIDPELFEAAKVDGANKLNRIWHITIPSLVPIASVLFILSLASMLQAGWEHIYLLRTPGNMDVSDILDTYVIQQGFANGQIGYATAVSLFQSVVGLVFVVITNMIIKKKSDISVF
ncbi:ABC transporter permease [Paenibacillus eucommiae]|uniref:Aldouronate transport system permease protein n=1 Tax=Paenibacillus eucommiae TaxID=1355755 RepID=A0ABS4J8W9_9BACL|nr:ABC transporter permease subunit [Paenibacillus eucommiae]MBP1996298.1 putative aldouronate transport system permease protein [Paenibacillus eucommiae]